MSVGSISCGSWYVSAMALGSSGSWSRGIIILERLVVELGFTTRRISWNFVRGQPFLGSIKRRIKEAKKQEKKIKDSTAGMKVQRGIDRLFLERTRLKMEEF
jgi:hypothetical protein